MRKLLISLVMIMGLAASACGNPLKATDPANPLFDPDKFSFDDYGDRYELIDAFRKLFPVGTPKEFVDRVLVKAGRAGAGQSKTYWQVWHYRQPRRMKYITLGPQHIFIFDEHDKLINIQAYGGEVLYEDQLTLDQLEQELIKKYKQQRKK